MKMVMTFFLVLSAILTCSTTLHADETGARVGYKYSIQHIQESAEAGDAAMQRLLAEILYNGDALKKDYALAYKWAFVSNASGEKKAKSLLKELDLFVSAEDQKKGKALGEQYLLEQKKKKAAVEESSEQKK
jgi:TPR repeat protein